jgi:tRNA dimethylallyltransferase
MQKAKRNIIVILGQTATGKSDLAVEIAKKYDGEIISADSRQVYQGLNIGTGKVTKKEMRGVKHYLLDVANPKKQFSVSGYQKLAISAIAEIISKGKLPILCGGTGFYIDAITKGIVLPEVPPNMKLRKTLEKKSTEVLFKMLFKLDKTRATNIDKNNKIRLIRAIEIAKALGKVPRIKEVKLPYRFIKVGLYLPEVKLREKINKRLLVRIKSGMIAEVKTLRREGLSFRRMRELGLEYRYLALYLQNKITEKEMTEKLNTEIYRYAKRQITWFKRDKETKWWQGGENAKVLKYLASKI